MIERSRFSNFLLTQRRASVLWTLCVMCLFCLSSVPAAQARETVDTLIKGGLFVEGGQEKAALLQVAIKDGRIHAVGPHLDETLQADKVIDATGMVVAPGFIDPHTHAGAELSSPERKANLNYLTQGVTTVFIGNDGGGAVDVGEKLSRFESDGIGTNVATYVGHGAVRAAVMGRADRAPTSEELAQMKSYVARAMQDGALGLSTGLYYVPGSYAATDEVVALAQVAADHGGMYDSHIRDESSYSIGLKAAVSEVIDIARQTGIAVHVAHIKALGVDVWGQSRDIVQLVEKAQAEGLKVTADQYPWRASGTSVAGALMPRWVMAGSKDAYQARLQDPSLSKRIREEMTENLRRRGGAEAVLITDKEKPDLVNRTLAEIAKTRDESAIDTALWIIQEGNARVASFNMAPEDIRRFMTQPWVMTSSDGSTGHPRKFASYPKKYADYVVGEKLLTLSEFVYHSAGQVADVFGLKGRGYLRPGYVADVIILDPEKYRPKADFAHPEQLTEGMQWVLLGGKVVIEEGRFTGDLAGKALRKNH
ncbi:N-acyl-D-amino-acid deacylase family protein [Paremcibacter congregatus]|nr:amidohydrolase family protein [Paremcibacter congregatus]QDE27672.1 amidohydrolase family protein [Paremcibacter congregatus]